MRIDRRRRGRRTPSAGDPLARMRMRAGPELAVVDVADTGALVEGCTRLLPGTRIDVHVVTQSGRVLVRSRVVRAEVWSLQADRMRYRAGIAFEHALDTSQVLAQRTVEEDSAPSSIWPLKSLNSSVGG